MNEGPRHNIVSKRDEKKLFFVLCLTAVIMLVEIVGGYISHSLALLADAGHMFTDVAALLMSWLAMRLGRKRPDDDRTYGYQRLKILAAYTNGVLLFFLAGIISVEAINRLLYPSRMIDAPTMLSIALIGFITNLVSYFILKESKKPRHDHTHHDPMHHHPHGDLNIKSASLHVLSDMLGSLGAVAAAMIILTTDWQAADPLLSLFVCGLIVLYALNLTKKTVHILIEGSPDSKLPEKIRDAITWEIRGVKNVHHIHVWSLTEKQPIATLDVLITPETDQQETLCAIQKLLAERFQLDHVTVQIEKGPCVNI